MADYVRRLIDPVIEDLLGEVPAVLLVGPRAAGKTTTAIQHAKSVVRLDRDAEAVAFRADSDSALKGLAEPVLLDEWQVVPSVLGAVKRAVDSDRRSGRFVLTGSIRADLESETWPGTGRVIRLEMFPLSIGEQLGSAGLFIEKVSTSSLTLSGELPDLRGYVELALSGGFPEPTLELSERTRGRWLSSYVDQILTRDVLSQTGDRDPEKLGRYFQAYTLNSAGLATEKTIYDAARINRETALGYNQLLSNLMVIDEVPAWTSNRLKRLVLSPKRYLIDSALYAGYLGVDVDGVMRDGDVLGRLLDTFVTAQVRAQLTAANKPCKLYHLRQEQGRREVDLIIEIGASKIIGVEIKSTSSPTSKDAQHLKWLKENLGKDFIAGIVLHTGPQIYELGDGIIAAPICTLWSNS